MLIKFSHAREKNKFTLKVYFHWEGGGGGEKVVEHSSLNPTFLLLE